MLSLLGETNDVSHALVEIASFLINSHTYID